jgi:hypothetical protein
LEDELILLGGSREQVDTALQTARTPARPLRTYSNQTTHLTRAPLTSFTHTLTLCAAPYTQKAHQHPSVPPPHSQRLDTRRTQRALPPATPHVEAHQWAHATHAAGPIGPEQKRARLPGLSRTERDCGSYPRVTPPKNPRSSRANGRKALYNPASSRAMAAVPPPPAAPAKAGEVAADAKEPGIVAGDAAAAANDSGAAAAAANGSGKPADSAAPAPPSEPLRGAVIGKQGLVVTMGQILGAVAAFNFVLAALFLLWWDPHLYLLGGAVTAGLLFGMLAAFLYYKNLRRKEELQELVSVRRS